MNGGRWLLASLLSAGAAAVLTVEGGIGPGLAALGVACGFLAQAGWSALRVAGTRMLAETRLEECVDSAEGEGPGAGGAAVGSGWPPGSARHRWYWRVTSLRAWAQLEEGRG